MAANIASMLAAPPTRKHVVAVLIGITAALTARAWLQVRLLADGLPRDYAADLAYLIVLPALLLLLFPVLLKDRGFLRDRFALSDISVGVVVNAVLIGVLLRVVSWGQLIAGVSLGIYTNDDPLAVEGPFFSFECAAPHAVFLGFAVMAVCMPVIEEVSHRGYVQTILHHRGPAVAVCVSALVFSVFHPPASWLFTYFAGVVFGVQYWSTGSLWPSVISHATVNAMIQIDWRCLKGAWNPSASDAPLWTPGILAILVVVASTIAIIRLLGRSGGRGGCSPRP